MCHLSHSNLILLYISSLQKCLSPTQVLPRCHLTGIWRLFSEKSRLLTENCRLFSENWSLQTLEFSRELSVTKAL